MTIETGSHSRRDCGAGATLPAPPLLYYALRTHRSGPMESPPNQGMPAGAVVPYSTSETELVPEQQVRFRPGAEESRSSRRVKLEPVESTATDRQKCSQEVAIGRNPSDAPSRCRR
jgi:hypothetical protein